ncbi:MAG: hypothetical protein JO199_04460 [Candidatus Eremiobacteraeota bacterium]|nr:hypothetical protein [Candidatus Eremiobacteraeota bacterium]
MVALAGCWHQQEAAQKHVAARYPCAMRGGWAFTGGCAVGNVGANGGFMAVTDRRRGVVVSFLFGPSDASRPQPFIVGEAAEAFDVVGQLGGQLFPAYGSTPCFTETFERQRCLGRPALYLLILNGGDTMVISPSPPAVGITAKGRFQGMRACGLATLVTYGQTLGWLPHALSVAPTSSNELHLAPSNDRQVYRPGGAFAAMAVVCR